MKKCSKCGEVKPFDEFHNDKNNKDGLHFWCKECRKKDYQEHKKEISEKAKVRYHIKGGRERVGCQSMYENKACAQFLGIVVAERFIKHLFNDVTMMPYGFPGYDMVCNRGKKINVKASTIHIKQNKKSIVNRWKFNISYNKKCDFFLLMAFDNVIDLNPLVAWMIPGSELNENSSVRISSSTIHKWDKWKMDMDNAQACCDLMKGKGQ